MNIWTSKPSFYKGFCYWIAGNPTDGYRFWLVSTRGLAQTPQSFRAVVKANSACREMIDLLTNVVNLSGVNFEL
jgi:hypothetical protein